MNILNFGSLNIDYVYRVDTFLEAGETKLSKDLNLFCGGKGLNQSIAMARQATPYTTPASLVRMARCSRTSLWITA